MTHRTTAGACSTAKKVQKLTGEADMRTGLAQLCSSKGGLDQLAGVLGVGDAVVLGAVQVRVIIIP